jgi:hypothetical protein
MQVCAVDANGRSGEPCHWHCEDRVSVGLKQVELDDRLAAFDHGF